MATPARWGLIGYGNIGKEVARQLARPQVAQRLGLKSAPEFIALPGGLFKAGGQEPLGYPNLAALPELPELPEAVFVAIPSSDDGKVAYDYIKQVLDRGGLAITAEKGAMANFFAELKAASDDFRRLGISATVGGGTRLLHLAHEYFQDPANISQIHLALNGTLAAIMDWVAPLGGQGMALDKAAERAVAAGYAEPGSSSASAIIKAEAEGDIPKKTAIFCNYTGLSGAELLGWQKLRYSLSEADVKSALDPAEPRRFLVSLYPVQQPAAAKEDIIGGFQLQHADWIIRGGFRRIDSNPLFSALASLAGPGNGLVVGLGPDISDGVYAITGPGAGVRPTANAMIDDFVRLRNLEVPV